MPQTDEQRAKARDYYAKNRERINEYQRARWAAKRDELTAQQRERYAENAERNRAYQQAWRDANRERVNEKARAARYGLTVEKLRELYEAAGGACQGCRVAEADEPTGRRLSVDHDHACCPGSRSCGDCVRGLLCHACNTTLGKFGDDPEALLRLARYLTERVRQSGAA